MQAAPRPAPAPPTKQGQCLKLVDFLVNDILMVLFSVCDIALDILVCRKFYLDGQMGFFYASLSIFLFAQCCYSFLFTLHWGKDFSSLAKCLVFFLVLPVGQFVPFLAWIESFEFKSVNKAFEMLNLHTKNNTRDEEDLRAFEEAGGDLLYEYIQRKFYSHAGFLIEALAEAIPQSILQTIAVLYFGEPSILFIVSIFVSICVISSKGYLISYSMHRPTFVFNFICIFADVLCMFATICWLFNYDDGGEDDTRALFDIHDGVKATWMCLFCAASALLVISSGCLMLFITLDKHHELDIGARYTHSYDSALVMYIEVHLAHFLSWFFSLIPMVVALLSFKFIFFPLSIQNQDQCNDYAKYKTFYNALHAFVTKNESDEKLYITNRFLLYCKGNLYKLQDAVNSSHSLAEKKIAVRKWLDNIDMNSVRHLQTLSEKNTKLFAAINSSDPKLARKSVRSFNTDTEITFFDKPFSEELAIEFKLFDTFFNKTATSTGESFPTCRKPCAYIRYSVALITAAIGLPVFVLFIPTAVVFLIYSWCYPLIELIRVFIEEGLDFDSFPPLPLYLSFAYTGTLLIMLCLAPNIYKFNRLCTDIVPLGNAGIPPVFFDVVVVKKIEAVCHGEMNWRLLDRVFDSAFGMDITLIIKSYCDPKTLNMGGLYGYRTLQRLQYAVPLGPPAVRGSDELDDSPVNSID